MLPPSAPTPIHPSKFETKIMSRRRRDYRRLFTPSKKPAPSRKYKGEKNLAYNSHDRKSIFKMLIDLFSDQNDGKMIDYNTSRGRYFWYHRARGPANNYYTVVSKGNYLYAYRDSGTLFQMMFRTPYREYHEFIMEYCIQTADLGWWDLTYNNIGG